MSPCVGGVIFPYFPALLSDRSVPEFQEIQPIAAAMEQAAARLTSCQPQALVVLSPGGAVSEDLVNVHAQPRLKGFFSLAGAADQVLGFETERLLLKHILQQSDRLGIPVQELTDEVLAEYHLPGGLATSAFVPLSYLHKAGFKGQIVYLSYGGLLPEEMYTLGKAVQLAAAKTKKQMALLVAAQLTEVECKGGRAWNKAVTAAIEQLSVKPLLELAKNRPEQMPESDLQALFFLLGGLSNLSLACQRVYYEEGAGNGQMIGTFLM